jgi:hypothetical protein
MSDLSGEDNLPAKGYYAGSILYRHPSGASILVFADGTMDARGANGKKKRTSATPEKLRDGHGLWKKVSE